MPELTITEVLPEADDRIWVTLSDDQTRLIGLSPLMDLPTYRALRLNRLIRCPRISADRRHVIWSGGVCLDIHSIESAPNGAQPLELLALLPSAHRFRPLAAVLQHSEPHVYGYPDVRPAHIVASLLSMKPQELTEVLASHQPAPPELSLARLSDLALFLSAWFPDAAIPALLRRPWPYSTRRYPYSCLLDTATGCLLHGRIDLVETPLLLLATERC